MGIVTLAKPNIDCLKKAIRRDYPGITSSHASEAIAFAFGFRTHTALLAAIDAMPPGREGWGWLDGNRLVDRLHQLSYGGVRPHAMFALIQGIEWPAAFNSETRETIERLNHGIRAAVRNANDN